MQTSLCDRVHQHIEKTMPLLEHEPSGKLPHPFITAGYGTQYGDTIYCWDNHHMSMRFALGGEPKYLKYTVDNFLEHQAADGYVPNVISQANGPLAIAPDFHALPFLMQAALMYVAQTQDTAWIEQTFPKLENYLGYFETHLSAPHGLFRWSMPWMGGIDNDAATTFFPPHTIIPADLNAWVYLEYLSAAKLADTLGKQDQEQGYSEKARALRKAVNDVLWMDEESSYAAYNLCESRPMMHQEHAYAGDAGRYAHQSCSNLVPLYARMADPDKAQRMLKKYVLDENHFLSPHGIRSLSKSSDYYNNARLANPPRFGADFLLTCSNWQGPVWIPLCYFAFNALVYYGLRGEAEDLADRTIRTLASSLDAKGSFAENYDAETGAPLYCDNFTSWNILADTMHDQLRTGDWIMAPVFE